MQPHSSYGIELVLLEGIPHTTTSVLSTPEEVEAFVAKELKANSVLTIVRMKNNADYGNYIAFVNANGLAHVRVLEHRGFYAKSPGALGESKPIAFKDETGCEFAVEMNATVSPGVAIEALSYWLPSQERSPNISWGEE